MQALYERDPDLSVIVPVYNLERYLDPLLTSLKMQELGGYKVEYIFVLNNCIDLSEEVIRESGLECTILQCSEQGCGPARNVGFEASKGQYIWFMDGDDWLLSTKAIKLVLDAVFQNELSILRVPFESDKFKMQYFSMVWQYVLWRGLIKDIRFPSIQPCEDDRYMEKVLGRLGLNCWEYGAVPLISKPLYYYNYMREGSNMYRHSRGERI